MRDVTIAAMHGAMHGASPLIAVLDR